MPVLKITVLVDVDDVPVTSFPLVRRVTYTNFEALSSQRASSVSFVALPSADVTAVQALVLTADQTVALGPSQTITVNPNGLLVLIDGSITAPTLQNNSGSAANIRAIVAGT